MVLTKVAYALGSVLLGCLIVAVIFWRGPEAMDRFVAWADRLMDRIRKPAPRQDGAKERDR